MLTFDGILAVLEDGFWIAILHHVA